MRCRGSEPRSEKRNVRDLRKESRRGKGQGLDPEEYSYRETKVKDRVIKGLRFVRESVRNRVVTVQYRFKKSDRGR